MAAEVVVEKTADGIASENTPPRWSLDDLYTGKDDPRIEETMVEVERRSHAFASTYRSRIARDLSADDFAAALGEYESIHQRVSHPQTYCYLLAAADVSPENGAFMQRIREQITKATLPLIFFELEIQEISTDRFAALLAAPAVSPFHHYLQRVRVRAPHRLSEPEERILEEQANTGERAFVRLYEEITAQLTFKMEENDEPLILSQILDLQYGSDRDLRKAAAEALTRGLEPHARTIAYIFNTLVQNKATEDRLRSYAFPEQSRHLDNELEDDTVETVVQTATEGFDLVARYYRAKAKLLNLPQLAHYDRYAVVVKDLPDIPFDQARQTILSAFESFHPGYAEAARAFFTGQWIDAAPRTGKRDGAFCAFVAPDSHPFILVNYLNKMGDVKTLAHELGHGVHSSYARKQRFLDFSGTEPIAEVASTFAELLVFNAMEKSVTGTARLALFAQQIEGTIATVFRQTTLYRFEQAVHRERREKGELSVARLSELWQERIGAMFGDSVELGADHALWWTYIPHFFATPFYVYSYTFGEMLALALYHQYEREGAPFADRYIEFITFGGSKSPHELVAPLGVDLNSTTFWRGALAVLEREIREFEEMAAR